MDEGVDTDRQVRSLPAPLQHGSKRLMISNTKIMVGEINIHHKVITITAGLRWNQFYLKKLIKTNLLCATKLTP